MGVPSLNDLAVDGTLNITNQPTIIQNEMSHTGYMFQLKPHNLWNAQFLYTPGRITSID